MLATRMNGGLTFSQAHAMLLSGHMTAREWRRFRWAWLWSAPRFGGWPAAEQDALVARRGMDAYRNRMARVRRALGLPRHAGIIRHA